MAAPTSSGSSFTLSIDNAEVSGLRARRISCAIERGGLAMPTTLLASLAAQKSALDACAAGGGAFDLAWKLEQGGARSTLASAGSPASASACVVAAAQKLVLADPGWKASCTARLLVGDRAGADAAAAALPPL